MVAAQAELEARLNAGEELSPGEVAALLGVGRTTVHDMLKAGRIRYTKTPGGHRRCNADDVRRLLAERRQVHGGDPLQLMPSGAEKDAALEELARKNRGEAE